MREHPVTREGARSHAHRTAPAQAGMVPLPLTFRLYHRRIRACVMRWFESDGRDFPWRWHDRRTKHPACTRLHDPYVILVAEVMLQQTQTSRVVEKLPEFVARFPDVRSLAAASTGDAIRAWRGMGYNSRVLRLREAMRAIVTGHGGIVPQTVSELEALPGIGAYTAAAVACFAFGVQTAVLDVNVQRVYSRMFFKCHTVQQTMPTATVALLAARMFPSGDAYRWHQAVMDLGATICTARRPSCSRCPVADVCMSADSSPLELFAERHAARTEPTIAGEPRRLWRGRIVELLRAARDPMRVAEVLDSLLTAGRVVDEGIGVARRRLRDVIGDLAADGFLVRPGGVREGGVQESDCVALPE